MDYVSHFQREVQAFAAAARTVAASGEAPIVPSCPEWSMADLVLHLGMVHRVVIDVIRHRLPNSPDTNDLALYEVPEDRDGWPYPGQTPHLAPLPPSLIDWFSTGATILSDLFTTTPPTEKVWSWSPEQTVGFWLRMQTIEAAVHRWDAENTLGTPTPIARDLAVDAITQTFDVMAPARRVWRQAPPGQGERFTFQQTDGPSTWTVTFTGPTLHLTQTPHSAEPTPAQTPQAPPPQQQAATPHDPTTERPTPRDPSTEMLSHRDPSTERPTRHDPSTERPSPHQPNADQQTPHPGNAVRLAGTASDLMLFLWNRVPGEALEASGNQALTKQYFALVPPV